MKFAVEYSQYTSQFFGVTEKLLDIIDEITIWGNPKDLTLFEFLIKYQNKRINIVITDNDILNEYKLISKIKYFIEEHPELNIAFAFTYNIITEYPDTFKELQDSKLNYYYYYAIDNGEDFAFGIQYNISDITVGNQLCFELDKCKNLIKDKNIQLRTDIGIAQKKFKTIADYQSFFIRPEDIEFYNQYIDVYNLYGHNEQKRDLKILYDIFAKDREGYGNLQEIILDLNEPIDSRCLLPNFAERRATCGRRCLYGSGCQICKNELELAKTLHDNDLMLESKK